MRYSHVCSVLLLLICESSAAGFKPSETFDYEVLLEEKGSVKLFWTYTDSNITFEVHAKTTGWVGFGISPGGGMKGADIAIGWVKDGKGHLLDTYAEGTKRPTLDEKQDLKLISAREYQGITSLKFSRMLISCDTKHDLNIKDETNRLIFAWGSTDPTDLSDVAYHGGNRGSKSVHLLEVASSTLQLPKDAFTFDVLNPNVTIPKADTTYWCLGLAVPKLDDVHHMIRVAPLITPGHEAMVHHILVYACDHEVDPKHHGVSQNCDNGPMPGKVHECSSIIAAWAIGGKVFDLPKHVGLPVGPGYGPKFLRMETHYDNPQNIEGMVDASGLRFTLTKELRAESAGILQTGHSVNPGTHIIPPHYPALVNRGICPSKCIAEALSNAGESKIKVFATVLHSHLMGRQIFTRVLRDKKEVANIGVDSNYDFNFQEFRILPGEVEIYPNDTIVTECVYDSSKRTNFSRGGLGTQEEMCMTFVYYYPSVNLSLCESEPAMPTLFNFVGVNDVDYSKWPFTAKSPVDKAGKTLEQLFPSPDDFRSSTLRKRYQDLLLSPDSQYFFNCRANGQEIVPFGSQGINRLFNAPAFVPADNNPRTAASCDDPFQPSEPFPHEALLEETGKVMLYWSFTETEITFEVHARTLGWVGLGISPGGGMAGADIAIGWVKGGQGHLLDTYAEGTMKPKFDDEQNGKLLSAKEYGGITALKFMRNLISCDSKQDLNIKDETIRLIFAWGSADPKDLSEVTYHGSNRGTKSIRLLQPLTVAPTPPPDAFTYDFLNPKVTIPTADTTYWCQAFKVPDLPSIHHLIKVSPVVQPGNEAMVHHILVYRCDHAVPDAAHGLGHECYHPNMPYNLNSCNAVVMSWAIGGGDFDFPEHVGFPVGPKHGPQWVVMETHYDNPSRLQGVVDNSGLRITLTPTLRSQNAGMLRTGNKVGPRHVIPPHFPEMTSRSFCSPDCWNEAMASAKRGSVKAFGSMLHAHLLGRKIKTRIIRNNTEVANLGADDNYDFNFQEMRRFAKEVELYPNDTIITDCVYDSSGRDTYTNGGLSTQEEMCLNFIYYYPAIPVTSCQTRLSVDATFESFGVTKWDRRTYRALEPADKAGKTIPELFPNASDWKNATFRQSYQDHLLADTTTYDAKCGYNGKDLKNDDALFTVASFAEQVDPAQKPSTCFDVYTDGASSIPVSFALIFVAMVIAA